jgi:hypothetical protein
VSEDQAHRDEAGRLTAELEQSNRRYRDALEAVDHSIPTFTPVQPAATRGDTRGSASLDPLWEVMQDPAGTSLVGRALASGRCSGRRSPAC